jgi:hypothetical protein
MRGPLTGRHLLVLQLRVAGYSLDQVAPVTGRSLDDVNGLIAEAAANLEVETEAAALAEALRLGLVTGRASKPARG